MSTGATIDGPRVAPASGRDPRSIVILAHGLPGRDTLAPLAMTSVELLQASYGDDAG
jgi:hypothetical protein